MTSPETEGRVPSCNCRLRAVHLPDPHDGSHGIGCPMQAGRTPAPEALSFAFAFTVGPILGLLAFWLVQIADVLG